MTRHVNVGVKLGSASGEHVRFHGSGTYDKIVLLKIKSSTGLNGNRSKIEAIAKIGFWFKVSRPRSTGQERGAEVQPAGILKYSEDLKRRPNTEIGTKDIFEIAS